MSVIVTPRESYAFMAWRRNPERDPSFRLQTEAEALEEAKRLATKRPGSTYIVLREVARVTINQKPAAIPPQRSAEPGDILRPVSPGSKGGAR